MTRKWKDKLGYCWENRALRKTCIYFPQQTTDGFNGHRVQKPIVS